MESLTFGEFVMNNLDWTTLIGAGTVAGAAIWNLIASTSEPTFATVTPARGRTGTIIDKIC